MPCWGFADLSPLSGRMGGRMNGERDDVVIGAEEPYFCFSSTLRIWGDIPDLEAISHHLGLEPTHAHRKGEKRGPRSPGYRHDHWSYAPPVAEERPLEEHIKALWEAVRQHVDYLTGSEKTTRLGNRRRARGGSR